MTYRLKIVRYQGQDRKILLQNENGPCPLLAAANALLLLGRCSLPPAAIRNDVATLQDVSNMLAEAAMTSQGHNEVFVDELVQHIPKFQYGMDVNPRFDSVTAFEYTSQHTAFDMLGCRLVHGWLVDPIQEPDTAVAIHEKSYNQVTEILIQGQEAATELEKLQVEMSRLEEQIVLQQQRQHQATQQPVDFLDDTPPVIDNDHSEAWHELNQQLKVLRGRQTELSDLVMNATILDHFLQSSSHQLTLHGLIAMHEAIKVGELCVFFRNNHFNTLTKHVDGHLYLLVTDLGYACSPAVVWEKLDVIDGDTEYVNSEFRAAGAAALAQQSGPTLTPEQMRAASSQQDADYHLALHLSRSGGGGSSSAGVRLDARNLDEEEGKIVAAVQEASLREYHGLPSNLSTPVPPSPASVTQAANGSNVPGLEVGVPVDPSFVAQHQQVPFPPSDVSRSWPSSDPAAPVQQLYQPAHLVDATTSQEQVDRLLALQMQEEASVAYGGAVDDLDGASLRLATQLQREENQRVAVSRQTNSRPATTTASTSSPTGRFSTRTGGTPVRAAARPASTSGNNSGCIIQ